MMSIYPILVILATILSRLSVLCRFQLPPSPLLTSHYGNSFSLPYTRPCVPFPTNVGPVCPVGVLTFLPTAHPRLCLPTRRYDDPRTSLRED